MKKQNAKIEFKLEQELFEKFKEKCEGAGQTMSKRLRNFIEKEVYDENYENYFSSIKDISKDIVNSISLLYFDIDDKMRENSYFKLREEEFIINLSSYFFVKESSSKALKIALKETTDIDLITQLTETLKEGILGITKYKKSIDDFYKNIKNDITNGFK